MLLLHSCGCLPVFTRLKGKYYLYKIVGPTSTTSLNDKKNYILFNMEWDGNANQTYESTYTNSTLISKKKTISFEDFCRKDELIITYEDGTKRHFKNVKDGLFTVTDYYKEEKDKNNIIYHYDIRE